MQEVPVEGQRVVDLSAGVGLLSVMAARLGATNVTAIQPLPELARLAKAIACANGVGDRVDVVPRTPVGRKLAEARRADVIIAENLGALLLSEGLLPDLTDARSRLAKRDVRVVPAGGQQRVVLVSAPSLRHPTTVELPTHTAVDLSQLGLLVDTSVMCATTSVRGFSLSAVRDLIEMSEPFNAFSLDFHTFQRKDLPLESHFTVKVWLMGRSMAP